MTNKGHGQRVLVTAGASGLGLEIARAFVRAGDTVAVCDVDQVALNAALARGDATHALVCDVADREGSSHMVAQAAQTLGGLDILVNNAGIAGPTGALEAIDANEWDRTLAINLTGAFNVTRAAIPWLKGQNRGAIINIGSVAGRLGFPLRSPYSASKWALVGLTKTLAVELGPWNVRVNAVLPGAVDGPRMQQVIEDKAASRGVTPDELLREMLAGMSIKRLVPPRQVAAMVAFLASPDGATVSGQVISVDGDTQMMA
jgi:NAD(P)-dependent dehydrogenase (short-subunit alcohol dehydrogenase family)